MCGEQFSYGAANTRRQGSPPRVRGTVKEQSFVMGQQRITPACAGNSIPCTTGIPSTPDHPRVCGEQLPTLLAQFPAIGSPPRVRGTARIK